MLLKNSNNSLRRNHLKNTPEQMVMGFHEKYGHLISKDPTVDLSPTVVDLRIKLIHEEYIELMDALAADDIIEIADGAADLVYVIVGTCISYGIPFDRILREVHNSNMTKTPVKATFGEKYGTKTPKGPDYLPPDIAGILTSPEIQTQLELKEINDSATVS
jgi:predicted HAD superfamily Cof-like phosphohydrolase